MKCFGLTGGIASGKSAITNMLKELGVPVIDADELSRRIMKPGSKACKEVKRVFGDKVFDAKGNLIRSQLGEIIFSDPDKRKLLEEITHPLIAEEMRKDLSNLEDGGHEYAVYAAPLLFEKNLDKLFPENILVDCSEGLQITRLIQRDGISKKEALKRIKSQLSRDIKQSKTKYIIDNNSTIEQSNKQLRDIWKSLTGNSL